MPISTTHLNGQPATAADLAPLAFAGYAHSTAMQVRDRAVRGLDLHLDRLNRASEELFGRHLPDSQVLGYLRAALEKGPGNVSVACFIGSRPGEFMPAGHGASLDVLVKVTDPAPPPGGPMTLDVVRHERLLPGFKDVGEVAKTLYLRRAPTLVASTTLPSRTTRAG